ncbi:MAG: sodium:panthothenate symporter [Lentisphaeria bacterium]|nr:sodium:panthothenate symporter [Lentisphaeria bacterium]
MHWIDWLITVVPFIAILVVGVYVKKYVKTVSDFLVAGRLCRRYVISASGAAAALGLITMVDNMQSYYKAGFAMAFWNSLTLPLSVILALSGFFLYRYRECRILSFGQLLEVRYDRPLRIFACFLRSIAEIIANTIMPAIAARFFIYYMDLPQKVNFLGMEIPTFMIVVFITLFGAILILCTAGELSLVITDTIQGVLFFPLVMIFVGFIFFKFSWSEEVIPVLLDRVGGQSFVDPFDLEKLRDFNYLLLAVTFANMILHRGSGMTGTESAAISAHEAKMAAVLGTWRGAISTTFYIVLAMGIVTIMHHVNYADDAKAIRYSISEKVSEELIEDNAERAAFMKTIAAIPADNHRIGEDKPFSHENNPDIVYFDTARKNFGTDGSGSYKTQQFKTLFGQLLLPATMRYLLPTGLVGAFCMMILLFILSTDDSRIYSASSTLVQDCIVPFYKKGELSAQKHIFYIRLMSILVGVVFFFGSYFMAQIDYIKMYVSITYGMWMAGCGPMILFGVYSRFGNSAGAWSSLLSGMFINLAGLLLQRNWAETVYPFLERNGWIDGVGRFLENVSRPMNPIVVWKMNAEKFPINSIEITLIGTIVSLAVYCIVSKLTNRGKLFDLDAMLHRDGTKKVEKKKESVWTPKAIFRSLLGINEEYSTGDKCIAWSVFSYSIIYKFFLTFIVVLVWNLINPWPPKWWAYYFIAVLVIVPGIASVISTFWFGIGGIRDLCRFFYDLKHRDVIETDNGIVEKNIEK